MKETKLWADKENVKPEKIGDAWCSECDDTAALLVGAKWHCGSCGKEIAGNKVRHKFTPGEVSKE